MSSGVVNIGEKVPDFTFQDGTGKDFHFYEEIKRGPMLLVFYPGDFTSVCTKQLCSYRDDWSQFEREGVRIVGLSNDESTRHAEFQKKHNFPFPLLTDTDKRLGRLLGCTSKFIFGAVSRAFVVVDKNAMLIHREVEPTPLTHPNAEKLLGVIRDLKQRGAL
jgi:thioredoxin-dependent peroxiredoxin